MSHPGGTDRSLDEDLVSWGRAARIQTRGRRTGRQRSAIVGFVDGSDGSVLVAAGSPQAHWALNLLADPRCTVDIGSRSFVAVAEMLGDEEHARAVRELILRYGTPSEGLGHGPSFRLRPVG
jgi:deazaflavin-dependent oxidoreductase (nitroreductase family)